MTAHARLSASGSHRWLACSASVQAEDPFPDTTSVFAEEGTAAHELGELTLQNDALTCTDFLTKTLPESGWVVTKEMADYTQEYVDYVRQWSGWRAIEVRVDFSQWIQDGFGTSDAIIIDGDTMRVIDLKYGKGIPVYAENNSQGMLYALGAYNDYGTLCDIKQVVITIVQPRLDHISEWTIDLEDLLKWGEWASQRAEATADPKAQFSPGQKQCQWCKAQPTCPALKKFTEDAIMVEMSAAFPEDLTPVNRLSHADLNRAMNAKALIVGWLSAVESHITGILEEGQEFEGWKLVDGRSLRQWDSENPEKVEAALFEALQDDAFERKLVSPAQAEKKLGKKNAKLLDSFIVKPRGKPTLVPESDPRPATNISVTDFDFPID